ncbi:SulP family inorganic anion transporter [Desulfatitalea tepidiphila]|uniref:SulP family inorganic anion transporter n=1 Tax=Desulfatitalea tepidiphila TaxID=1185843 RepID=UPI0006B63214|nr:SulP family inorganic anion transporter [Desulfatitalea tepidiphila]
MHFHPQAIVPFLSWLRGYRRPFFKPDLFAGLTVAVVAVPQSMAYALIAGLPVSFGLYASIVPTIIGCLWGSSSHLITGPTTAVSLVVFSTLSSLAEPNSAGYIEMALFLALMVGALQLIMGVARLGTLLNFVSHAVLIGFTTGAAALIAFKQLPALLGLKIEKTSVFFEHLFNIITNLHEIEIISLGLGTLTIVIILGFKKFRPNWPGTLLAMVAVGSLVAIFDLDRQGVAVVGAVSGDIPLPGLPDMHLLAQAGKLAPGALAIAILGLVEAVSIAKSIADQTRQRINVNQEFIGQGLANVSAALFSGYAGSGSFTRSAVNFRAGARTPLSGIISGIAVALTVLIAAPLAAKLPISALAGVLVVVAYDMIRVRDIVRTLKTTRGDAAVLVITFASTLLLNIEFAIYVGVLLSIGLHLAATSHPRIQSVVPDPATGKMRASSYGETCCQMEIVAIEGSLFFGSAAFVLDDLQRRLRSRPQTANLLIRMHKVNTMDASGVHVLEILLDEVRRRGGGIYFSGVNHGVFLVLKNSGFLNEIGAGKVHATTRAAIRQAMRESFFPAICATCPEIVFEECPALKRGHWEIFGPDIHPRDSQAGLAESGQPAIDQREESHPGAPSS